MSSNQRQRTIVTPIVLVSILVLVGVIGLVMLFLGIGGSAPTEFKVPGVNLDLGTTNVALAVTILGFASATAVMALTFAYSVKQTAEKRKLMEELVKAGVPVEKAEDVANRAPVAVPPYGGTKCPHCGGTRASLETDGGRVLRRCDDCGETY